MATLTGYRRAPRSQEAPALHPDYKSTVSRAPQHPPLKLPHSLSEITGPQYGREHVRPEDLDLTHYAGGEAQGQRIIVSGRVMDTAGIPVPDAMLEVWQCNAAGRYRHEVDQHDAPLDPHFSGKGRAVTDANGDYRFLTIEPGAYPWGNHDNAWRPKHIHFSIFGPAVATRLVTQMYFPGDPLLEIDPIFQSVPTRAARQRLVALFDLERTEADYAIAYRFDIVLRGREATPKVD